MRYLITVTVCLICLSCATQPYLPEVQTASDVDLSRYQGTWYEIARLPAWFQRDCMESMATYTLDETGNVAVINECVTKKGEKKRAFGTASVVDSETNAKLEVLFDNWFSRLFPSLTKGKYWILYLDPDYQTVIVGTPDRKYLWIMARTPELEEAAYQELVDLSQNMGFNTSALRRVRKGKQ
jgi:apolipoprotein D and lipocalin family protein